MKKTTIMATAFAMALATGLGSCSKNDNGKEPDIPPVDNPTQPETKDVRVITTTSNRSQDLKETWLPFIQEGQANIRTITLKPEEMFQTMDGFGAAVTGSTCYNLMKMKPEDRKAFIELTFDPKNGYGFSYVRIAIGCSDFSLKEYTCCDTEGIENFALTSEETDYVIPILKEILAVNPNLKIMGSPWTPPRWMKVNNLKDLRPHNQWTSGQLNPKYYKDYGKYFVKWIQAFRDNGIKIYSVTPQNEPLNRGNSASCYMGWEEERDFVKTGLGPALREAGLDVKVFAFDHNYNYDNIASENKYPVKIFNDSEAAQYFAGAAFHNYGGNKNELISVHNAAPGMDLVFTETSIGTWNNGRDLGQRLIDDMEQVALGTVNNWCKGVIVWNLMLDSDMGPNRPGGCQTCFGAVDINKDYTTITRNSHYYIIAHLSSVVKPDAVRIGTSGYSANGLTYTAFRNSDGSYALVLSNGDASNIELTVRDGSKLFNLTVPAKSAVSCTWK